MGIKGMERLMDHKTLAGLVVTVMVGELLGGEGTGDEVLLREWLFNI